MGFNSVFKGLNLCIWLVQETGHIDLKMYGMNNFKERVVICGKEVLEAVTCLFMLHLYLWNCTSRRCPSEQSDKAGSR